MKIKYEDKGVDIDTDRSPGDFIVGWSIMLFICTVISIVLNIAVFSISFAINLL